ncbi:hypothetical protein J6590_073659 [Homalodisca vitripennis]|nr:hypothetical protein J6590_073659 [Homalodisca vitripennis]
MYECVLSPYELTLDIDHQPVCYHSPQLIRNKKEGDAESITAILINLRSNAELYKMNHMCRFCMDTISEDYVEIFGNSGEAAKLRRIYEELMPFTVNVCDEFPHKICRTCIQDLKTCHTLMEKFKKAYRCLQHVAKYSLFVENDDVTDANSDPVELPCNDEGIIQPDEQKGACDNRESSNTRHGYVWLWLCGRCRTDEQVVRVRQRALPSPCRKVKVVYKYFLGNRDKHGACTGHFKGKFQSVTTCFLCLIQNRLNTSVRFPEQTKVHTIYWNLSPTTLNTTKLLPCILETLFSLSNCQIFSQEGSLLAGLYLPVEPTVGTAKKPACLLNLGNFDIFSQ